MPNRQIVTDQLTTPRKLTLDELKVLTAFFNPKYPKKIRSTTGIAIDIGLNQTYVEQLCHSLAIIGILIKGDGPYTGLWTLNLTKFITNHQAVHGSYDAN